MAIISKWMAKEWLVQKWRWLFQTYFSNSVKNETVEVIVVAAIRRYDKERMYESEKFSNIFGSHLIKYYEWELYEQIRFELMRAFCLSVDMRRFFCAIFGSHNIGILSEQVFFWRDKKRYTVNSNANANANANPYVYVYMIKIIGMFLGEAYFS